MNFDALIEGGRTESFGEHHFVALLTLESGARYGVVQTLAWALARDGALVLFEPGSEKEFIELFEHARGEIDAALENAVRALGLPEELAWSFPAVELVRAMIATGSPHFTRVALSWLLPTELRELRSDILRVAEDATMIAPVRELARRMVVPERG